MDSASVTQLLSGLGTLLLVVGLVISAFALARRSREQDQRLRRIERLLDDERNTSDRPNVPL